MCLSGRVVNATDIDSSGSRFESHLRHVCIQLMTHWNMRSQVWIPLKACVYSTHDGGGWLRQRCCVSCVTKASNWDWLTVGQGQLSLQQVRVEGVCFYFFVSSLSFIFLFLPCPSFSSPLLSLHSLFSLFSERRHKMTHKVWGVIKP